MAFAVDLITSDPRVKAILVNIFGGIVDCRTIAKGLIRALQSKDMKMPLVVRLEGKLSFSGFSRRFLKYLFFVI